MWADWRPLSQVRDLPPFSLPVWESFWQDLYARLPYADQFHRKIPQMVLVDAGMTASLNHVESGHIVDFFHAVSVRKKKKRAAHNDSQKSVPRESPARPKGCQREGRRVRRGLQGVCVDNHSQSQI